MFKVKVEFDEEMHRRVGGVVEWERVGRGCNPEEERSDNN